MDNKAGFILHGFKHQKNRLHLLPCADSVGEANFYNAITEPPNGPTRSVTALDLLHLPETYTMKSLSAEKEKIAVDYGSIDAPKNAKNFMPDVYKDGEHYLCLFGIEPDQLIIGTGASVQEALDNWEEDFLERQKIHY